MIRDHRDTDFYWSLEDDPVSWFKNSGIITEWLLLLLVDLNIPTPPGIKWVGHSLRRGDPSSVHDLGVSIAVIMTWGLWKSLDSPGVLVNNCWRNFDLTSVIRDRSSKVEIQITGCIQPF